ncbi:class I SAM-dependent methyltransferase [Fimbriiglobus ruber]|uniref:3-demethylubiquinol 3-O-methyltransferase n=1 Tax=Fimbriiglobus ruber TaxID=1908690 RepID=A0A225DUH5_9BACT|nr:class I SAM-dependent methyltransferase [Fimbriiglobus ruber]OWK44971.1 3-demethylubiquinol 3-O-methyltransferase [Fimbriiglobus ruber]
MPTAPTAPPESRARGEARCLLCHSPALVPLYAGVRDRLRYVPGDREWWRCRACGSAVLVPQPRPDELPGFYPPVYSFTPELGKKSRLANWLARLEYHFFFRPQYLTQVRRVMRCTGAAGRGWRLLDIGCGRGLRLLELRGLGYEVHGLDIQPDVVRYLREELNIPAVCAGVEAAEEFYPPGSFDVVTAFYLMEHINDVTGFLRACYRLLRPGGWVAVAIPFADSIQAGLFGGRWINVTEAPRHLSLPTQKGALFAVRRAGFERARILPDSVINCAGQIGSSMIPGSTLTHAYGKPGLRAFVPRFVGAAVTLVALPFCLAENYAAGKPSLGIVCARKPDHPGPADGDVSA